MERRLFELTDRPEGTNRSWQDFNADAVDCCHAHISSRGRAR